MIDARIRFRHLNCFLEVARQHSVVRAADRLAVSQPAVSKTLRELEDILELKLFQRGRKGLTLTPLGQLFQTYASASLASLREGVASLREARGGGAQPIGVGVLPTVAARLMPATLTAFRGAGGRGPVRLVTGPNDHLLAQLRVGELDLVVGRLGEAELMSGLSFQHLYPEPLRVVVRRGHPLASGFDPARIADYPLVLPSAGTVVRQDAERLLIGAGVWPITSYVETFSVAFGRQYVLDGEAVWIVALGVVADDLAADRFVELPLDTSAAVGPVGLTVRADAPRSAAAELFLRCLHEVAASIRRGGGHCRR